jgi:hypothetical protein
LVSHSPGPGPGPEPARGLYLPGSLELGGHRVLLRAPPLLLRTRTRRAPASLHGAPPPPPCSVRGACLCSCSCSCSGLGAGVVGVWWCSSAPGVWCLVSGVCGLSVVVRREAYTVLRTAHYRSETRCRRHKTALHLGLGLLRVTPLNGIALRGAPSQPPATSHQQPLERRAAWSSQIFFALREATSRGRPRAGARGHGVGRALATSSPRCSMPPVAYVGALQARLDSEHSRKRCACGGVGTPRCTWRSPGAPGVVLFSKKRTCQVRLCVHPRN